MGHEEYANVKWNISLENALHRGYVRLQAISPKYLFVDHAQRKMRETQIPAATGFFFDHRMAAIPYKEMAIERAGGDMRVFKSGQNTIALQFTINGEVDHEESTPLSATLGNAASTNIMKQHDLSMIHPAYNRPGVNPIGDSTNYSFGKWLAEHKKK